MKKNDVKIGDMIKTTHNAWAPDRVGWVVHIGNIAFKVDFFPVDNNNFKYYNEMWCYYEDYGISWIFAHNKEGE